MHDESSIALSIPGLGRTLHLQVHDDKDQHVSASLRRDGIWEGYETRLVLEQLKPGQVFIDAGANIGYYSLLAAERVGQSGRVYAFEPEARNFQLLATNILVNDLTNVEAVEAGLAAEGGQGQIFVSEHNLGDHQVYDDASGRRSFEIRLVQGDAFLAGKVERVDFIKVDTQGAEFGVLKGLDATIRRSLPDLTLVVEFWPAGLRRAGSGGHALLELLASYHLPMFVIDHQRHLLFPCVENDIRRWLQELESDPGNEGFVNLLLTRAEVQLASLSS